MKPVDFVLIRGLSREQGHWCDFWDQLQSQDFVDQMTAIDLPGNGRFFRLNSLLSIGAMAEFAYSQLPPKGENPRVILAYSMGAMVAIEMLHRYPQAFAGAFLVNTSISGLSHFYQRLKPNALESFYRILHSENVEEREKNVLKLVSNVPENRTNVLQKWVELAEARPISALNALRQLVAAGRYRLPTQKPQTPLFLLTSKADRMVDYHCSKALAEVWNLPIAIHSQAGHEITLDAPDWVIENLKSWLEDLFSVRQISSKHPEN